MRPTRAFVSLPILLGLLILVGCPEPDPAARPVDAAAERDSIQALLDRSRDNITTRNWDALQQNVTDDFTHFAGGQSMTLGDMRSFFEANITDHQSSFNDVDIHVSQDGRLAWATFREQTSYVFDGQPVDNEQARFTATFEKRNDRWMIAHVHRSTPPPGDPPPGS